MLAPLRPIIILGSPTKETAVEFCGIDYDVPPEYIDFSGRASRSEYWWFTLLTPFVLIASYIYFRVTGGDTRIVLPVTLFFVFMILPSM